MTKLQKIQQRAQTAHAKDERKRRNPRYRRVIGKLVAEGLLVHNKVPATWNPVTLEDALWAGDLEPRVLELLPGILLKRPGLFRVTGEIPPDLRQVLNDLRHGNAEKPFRGIPARDYAQWVPRIGRQGKMPSLLKTFRFSQDDITLIEKLKRQSGTTEIELIRKALRALEKQDEA